MALFHFSEDPSIACFHPRSVAARPDSEPMVWAIDEEHAPHYYLPRDCPRVILWPSERATAEAMERFFAHSHARCIMAIESGWLDRVRQAQIYRYTLPMEHFTTQDDSAGYYVSRESVTPIEVAPVGDLLEAICGAGIELRLTPSLWPLRHAVVNSSLEFSIIRMRNAQPETEFLKS
jgi:hypothetical protein